MDRSGRGGDERPLADVRSALERTGSELDALLRRTREDLEARLKQAERTAWSRDRGVQSLEGFLGRIAAILGVEIGEPPDWNELVSAAVSIGDRMRALEAERERCQQLLEQADATARRFQGHAATVTRIAARLGLTTTGADELLQAIDELRRG